MASPSLTLTSCAFEVQFVDKLGDDSRVVDAARVSFGGKQLSGKDVKLSGKDVKLVQYLAREKHFSPFRHCMLVFRIKCPEFVARQMYKHCVGIEGSTPVKDTPWNELSGRYRVLTEVYVPPVWHTQHKSAKQCSGEPVSDDLQVLATETVRNHYLRTWEVYESLLKQGVAREEARTLLPLSFMTEFVWTASLQAVQNFVILRKDAHAQREIQMLAAEIERIANREFPVAFPALMSHP